MKVFEGISSTANNPIPDPNVFYAPDLENMTGGQ